MDLEFEIKLAVSIKRGDVYDMPFKNKFDSIQIAQNLPMKGYNPQCLNKNI